MRSELTPTQMAEHLAKRKELWIARQDRVEQLVPVEIGYKKPPKKEKGFAADTAEKTGVNKSTITRAISRAEGVTQEARDAIRGTEHEKVRASELSVPISAAAPKAAFA
ncbi:hypothetical protein J7394_00075 [Ruegeria sp. R13_0]|uniref:hypothetical protein n=1 Tax=Ruegeria sp. R13_0 TaxID=2821099 RepID=UPI001ADB0EB0|nr:hypothetical protein [Ruegeria sp. R13_0]MBO9432580.1 hypothetical protein [Ruegeria sp. R13_0]